MLQMTFILWDEKDRFVTFCTIFPVNISVMGCKMIVFFF